MNDFILLFHPLRTGMASLAAFIFELCLNPMLEVPKIISSVVGGSGADPLLGDAMNNLKTGIEEIAIEIGTSLAGVGLALCVLFFLIALIELAMSERMTLEYFIKFFTKLVVGVWAVVNWEPIYKALRGFGEGLSEMLSDGEGTNLDKIELTDKFLQAVEGQGAATWLIIGIASLFLGAIFVLITFGMVIVTYIICFTWMMEVALRGAFLPIACALLSDDGWRGAGGRYLRRFAGVCAQGGVMVAIGKMGGSAMSTLVTGFSARIASDTSQISWVSVGNLFPSGEIMINIATCTIAAAGLGLAIISIMFKSSSIVMDVFGG